MKIKALETESREISSAWVSEFELSFFFFKLQVASLIKKKKELCGLKKLS